MQPTPVRAAPAGVVLDQNFAENAVQYMRQMGAKNVDPPLPRSQFLKNTKTGLVLPWSVGLAEQRDIMVNCDAYGNTEPTAWASTVISSENSEQEQQSMHDAAMQAVRGYTPHVVPRAEMPEPNAPVEMPHGAQHLDEFMAERNQELVGLMEAAL